MIAEELQRAIAKNEELYAKYKEAEKVYKEAEKAYKDFANGVLPDMFLNEGLSSLTLDNGQTLNVVVKTSTSIKKDSKKDICKWLIENGGEGIVQERVVVTPNTRQFLEENNIPYDDVFDVNTISLKALLLEKLGQKGIPATMDIADIPEGINFYQWREVEVK